MRSTRSASLYILPDYDGGIEVDFLRSVLNLCRFVRISHLLFALALLGLVYKAFWMPLEKIEEPRLTTSTTMGKGGQIGKRGSSSPAVLSVSVQHRLRTESRRAASASDDDLSFHTNKAARNSKNAVIATGSHQAGSGAISSNTATRDRLPYAEIDIQSRLSSKTSNQGPSGRSQSISDTTRIRLPSIEALRQSRKGFESGPTGVTIVTQTNAAVLSSSTTWLKSLNGVLGRDQLAESLLIYVVGDYPKNELVSGGYIPSSCIRL